MSKPLHDTTTQETTTLPAGMIAPSWELTHPLTLTVSADEDGWFVVSDDVFHVYGDGETLDNARQDYIVSLIDYYRLVERDALGGEDSDRCEFERAQTYIRHQSH